LKSDSGKKIFAGHFQARLFLCLVLSFSRSSRDKQSLALLNTDILISVAAIAG